MTTGHTAPDHGLRPGFPGAGAAKRRTDRGRGGFVTAALRRRLREFAAGASIVALLAGAACDDNDPIYGVGGAGNSGESGEVDLAIVLGDLQNGRTSEAYPEPLVVQAGQPGGGPGPP